MATPTLSTTVSRRSMIAGSTAVVAIATIPSLSAAADIGLPNPNPDARLFRRIAVAERLRKQHARARKLRDRLFDAFLDDPAYPPLPHITPAVHDRWREVAERSGYYPAMLRRARLFRRYAAAVRAAVAVPAHTVRGVQAKLALALIAARCGHARIYLYEDHEWLQFALADLERLARA